jgi:hypothetical protein
MPRETDFEKRRISPERLEKERGQYVEQLVGMSRYFGELETQVLQLGGAPRGDHALPHGAGGFGKAPNTRDVTWWNR